MRPLRDVLWAERTRDEFADLAARGAVVVLPIGSTEQHGLHLPVDTDCHSVETVAVAAARSLDAPPVLLAPTIAYGISPHHMAHGGTISLRVETLVALLGDICQSIVTHGFERILILSGHGGNGDTIRAAALQLRHTMTRQIHACCWFDLAPDAFASVNEGPTVSIGHAGEAETSIMLAVDPDSVRRERCALVTGITDDPALGSADKGRRLLEAGTAAVRDLIVSIGRMPGREIVGIRRVEKRLDAED